MMGLKTTISRLCQNFGFIPAEKATVDHLVIGAGVVGLAVAQELINRFRDRSTFVVEWSVIINHFNKHFHLNTQPGQGTMYKGILVYTSSKTQLISVLLVQLEE
ncbi:hypothetical protein MJO28_005996 [Puccinia striiformis f. sp. tritici]|uniref:Uncharacterized protein n=1 Tax=Puccinia striiformis f. sp. tritici TaxID=168172 RepID=A0ACC0EGY7_9BASI|nr:hypothetical protein MJO28_005996 [Puccinia striiformis f. sp. tritici]